MSYTFETEYLLLELGEDARVLQFTDKKSGRNLAKQLPFGKIVLNDRSEILPCALKREGENLTVLYPDGNEITLKCEEKDGYIAFYYTGAKSEDFWFVTFAEICVGIDYLQDSSFVACGMGLTVNTHMAEYPGRNNRLAASAYTHVGTKGAGFAVIGSPEEQLNAIMRRVVDAVPDGILPKGVYNGPYAKDCPFADATYVIRVDPLHDEDMDEYIATLKEFGVSQVNLHQAKMFRTGDFEVNRSEYPDGRAGLKRIIDRFHAEGIKAVLHSYTFFIDPYGSYKKQGSRYLYPIPHKDLMICAEYTLAEDVDKDGTYIKVKEPLDPKDFIFGYPEIKSPILRIDDELVHIERVDEQGFYIERSAFKTANAEHTAGVKIKELGSYFTHLMPAKNSQMFYEVAKNTADFYNECDFDGFYLDAIDGSFALDSGEFSWYHAVEFVNEVFKHIKKPALFNCCYGPQYPGHWYARTLMGAFDAPGMGYRDFTDVHVNFNEKFAERMYLVSELGWWRLFPVGHMLDYKKKVMWQEDIEYLMVKMLATDSAMCWLSGFEEYKNIPMLYGYLPTVRKYTELRDKKYFSAEVKKILRQPQKEYHLVEKDGKYSFVSCYTDMQKTNGLCGGKAELTYKNRFGAQKPKIRIEGLYTAKEYDDSEAITLFEFDQSAPIEDGKCYPAATLSANKNRGLGIWVNGDGKGETLCLRLHSPSHLHAGYGDYFIKIDFTGWKYFSRRELQNAEQKPEDFPVQGLDYKVFEDTYPFYAVYDGDVDMNNLESVETIFWPKGDYRVCLKDIKAMPEAATVLQNPTLTAGGKSITFNARLGSGEYIEYCPQSGECVHKDLMGKTVSSPTTAGEAPILAEGENKVILSAGCDTDLQARAAVTLITYGEEI